MNRREKKLLQELAKKLGPIHEDVIKEFKDTYGSDLKTMFEKVGNKEDAQQFEDDKKYPWPVYHRKSKTWNVVYRELQEVYNKTGDKGVKAYVRDHKQSVAKARLKHPRYYHLKDMEDYNNRKENDLEKLTLCLNAIESSFIYAQLHI